MALQYQSQAGAGGNPDAAPGLSRIAARDRGCLLAVREAAFVHLDRLEALDGVRGKKAEAVLREAGDFLEKELCRPLPEGFAQADPQERKRWCSTCCGPSISKSREPRTQRTARTPRT
jgi:hypothetical protein